MGRAMGKLGSRHSEATRAKMRAASLGRKKSAAHAANIAQARVGMRHTQESKDKNRAAHLGRRHTPEALERIRRVAREQRSGPGHHWWGQTPKHGPRTHWHQYNGTALRSAYEVRFAQEMDRRGMGWEYEPKRFDLGTCTYLPDFYVPSTGAFWEIKGWFGPRDQRKVALFRERYPEVPLIVADNAVLTIMEAA